MRAKENTSKLSGKKKKEDSVKRLDSTDLAANKQRSSSQKCSPSAEKKSGNVMSDGSFVNDPEVNKIMPPKDEEEAMSLKVPETAPIEPATTS